MCTYTLWSLGVHFSWLWIKLVSLQPVNVADPYNYCSVDGCRFVNVAASDLWPFSHHRTAVTEIFIRPILLLFFCLVTHFNLMSAVVFIWSFIDWLPCNDITFLAQYKYAHTVKCDRLSRLSWLLSALQMFPCLLTCLIFCCHYVVRLISNVSVLDR